MPNSPKTLLRQLEVSKTYSVDTWSPEVLGSRLINVKCLAVLSSKDAISAGLDIYAYHERMRPHLPAGYNNNPSTMIYVKVQSMDGKETILAMDWLNLETLVETNPKRALIEVNGVSVNDVEVIRRSLVIQGYSDISITLTE